jgi:hypothetical protein
MTTPLGDRRKRTRRALSLYLRFINNRTGEPVGDLADASRDGFMLESVKPIPLNAEFSFRVDLPAEISEKTFMIFTARSRWSRRDPVDGRLYDTGFEVLKMDASDIRAFELLFDRYGSRRTGTGFGTD